MIQNPNSNPSNYNPRIVKVSRNKGNSPGNPRKSNTIGKITIIKKLHNNEGRTQGVNELISNSFNNNYMNNNLMNISKNNIYNSQRVNYLMPELNKDNNVYITQYNNKISNLKTSPKNSKYSQIAPSHNQSYRNTHNKERVNIQFSNTSPNKTNNLLNPYEDLLYDRIPKDNIPKNKMNIYQYNKKC
jgi:hypothetical protein